MQWILGKAKAKPKCSGLAGQRQCLTSRSESTLGRWGLRIASEVARLLLMPASNIAASISSGCPVAVERQGKAVNKQWKGKKRQ